MYLWSRQEIMNTNMQYVQCIQLADEGGGGYSSMNIQCHELAAFSWKVHLHVHSTN